MMRAPRPDPNPLIITTCRGSFIERLLVQLFSKPQNIQENRTNKAPIDILIDAASPAVRMILAREMKAIASNSLLPTASLKIIMAITEVAAISKLPKRAAVLES